jgi:hypothetical protein
MNSPDAARGRRYEVYIDVRHHPKHGDDDEQRESTAFKLADVDYDYPLKAVANCLRDFADELDERSFERHA